MNMIRNVAVSIKLTRAEIGNYLFPTMTVVEPYPHGVGAVPAMVSGTAFFPGGAGVWCEDSTSIFPDVMVLGHDFSTKTEHESFLNGVSRDIDSTTWRELIKLARKVGLDLNRCFFSNAFMGLRTEGTSTDNSPAHKDKFFRTRNADFLRFQISVIKPKLIIVLGQKAPKIIAEISDDLSCWRKFSFPKIDKVGLALLPNVRIDDNILTCVSILHTSFRGPNLRWRTYRGLSGNLAEVQLLKDALNTLTPLSPNVF